MNSRGGADLLGGRVEVDNSENSMDERAEPPSSLQPSSKGGASNIPAASAA
jgi:hypothetical protein